MASKAKKMRIHAVMCGAFPLDAFRNKRFAAKRLREIHSHARPSYRVVEFVAVTPRKRQKGKK